MAGPILLIGLCWLGLWGWFRVGWSRLKVPTPERNSLSELPVSLVVAAHNEEKNLSRLFRSLESVGYPDWEFILVLDRCTDESEEVAQQHRASFSNLRILSIQETPEGWSPKKWAVQQGVEAAIHPYIVLTDADCEVAPGWLCEMAAHFHAGSDLVLGLGWYKTGNKLVHRMVEWETAFTAFQYVGAAGWQRPYMGVGRNLGYRKASFEEAGGLSGHSDTLSGDDDLLVQALGRKKSVTVATHYPTWSEPPHTFREWVRQKSRHVSSSHQYSFFSKLLLAGFHGMQLLWWGLLICGLLTNSLTFLAVVALYIFRILPATIGWYSLSGRLQTRWWAYPALDLMYFLYNLSVIPRGLIRRPTWT